MTTILTRIEDKEGDVSLALGRCADKISFINELFLNLNKDGTWEFAISSPGGLSWILMDIEDDLRFLDENYTLEKIKSEEKAEAGKEAG